MEEIVLKLQQQYHPHFLAYRARELEKCYGRSSTMMHQTLSNDLDILRGAYSKGSELLLWVTYLDRIHAAYQELCLVPECVYREVRFLEMVRRAIHFVTDTPNAPRGATATTLVRRPAIVKDRAVKHLFHQTKQGSATPLDKIPMPYTSYLQRRKTMDEVMAGLESIVIKPTPGGKTEDRQLDRKVQRLVSSLGIDFLIRVRQHFELELHSRFAHAYHTLSWRDGLPAHLTMQEFIPFLFAQEKIGTLAKKLYLDAR